MLIHELHIWSYQAIQFCSKEFRILSTFEAIELYEEYWHVRFSSCGNICWVCKCGCWSSSKYRFPVICNSLKTKTPPWKITHIRVECECHTVYFCVYCIHIGVSVDWKWKMKDSQTVKWEYRISAITYAVNLYSDWNSDSVNFNIYSKVLFVKQEPTRFFSAQWSQIFALQIRIYLSLGVIFTANKPLDTK